MPFFYIYSENVSLYSFKQKINLNSKAKMSFSDDKTMKKTSALLNFYYCKYLLNFEISTEINKY